ELCGRGGDGGGAIEAATTATQGSFRRRPSSSSATFSPITPAPIRVGEDQPPPSWDPIPSPRDEVKKRLPYKTETTCGPMIYRAEVLL
ncbi:unnamed protein product, partial [Urochloa humidicola]